MLYAKDRRNILLRHKNQTPHCGRFVFVLVLQCGRSVRNLRLPGSGRQLMKTSHLAKFESYVAKGAHCANVAQMGIRQSLHLRHKNQTPHCGRFVFVLVLQCGRMDAPERSAWRIRECAIRKILKNRPGKIVLIFIIAYRGQEFIFARNKVLGQKASLITYIFLLR